MFARISVFLVCLTGLLGVSCKTLKLPSYLKSCHRSDPNFDKCTIEHAKESLSTLIKGDRKYGIPVLSPLVLPSVVLDIGEQLKLTITDLHIAGCEQTDIKKAKFDLEKKRIELQFHFEKLKITGIYDVNGRILVLPIQGNGDLNVTAVGMKVDYSFDYTLDTKNGEKYLIPSDPHADFTADRVHFYFANLFNGNQELGDSTNSVLDQEWEKILEEIKPSITKLIVQIANGIVLGITSKVPYSEFFPE